MAGSPRSGVPALTAAEIAVLVGGTLAGESTREVCGAAPLNRAGPDQLSFLADKRYAFLLTDSRAGVVLLAPEFATAPAGIPSRIVVAKPYDALVALLPRLYRAPDRPPGIHPTAIVSSEATIGADVTIEAHTLVAPGACIGDRAWIGPLCVVGDGVEIGADARLVSQVTCYPGTILGARVIVHAGVRLGSDGFGYAFAKGAHQKIMHVGRCIIGDDVEIGANTCIDRGSVDDTVVGTGTKIDNLVQVAHNVHIGRHCLLMSQVGLAGSVHVEDGAILAGQVGVAGHLTIGSAARVGAQAGVISDVPAGATYSGYPARPHRDALRSSAALARIVPLLKRLEQLLDGQE